MLILCLRQTEVALADGFSEVLVAGEPEARLEAARRADDARRARVDEGEHRRLAGRAGPERLDAPMALVFERHWVMRTTDGSGGDAGSCVAVLDRRHSAL